MGVGIILSQTTVVRDTFKLQPGTHAYPLKHKFVVRNSIQFITQEDSLHLDSLQTVLGILYVSNEGMAKIASISYRRLNTSVPVIVGPYPSYVKPLDSLFNQKTFQAHSSISGNTIKSDSDYLFTSGSFFRSIDMSTNGGAGLGGGLRLQLAGNLGKELNVSGVITDERFPIQPEGTTQSLEEVDKIYLEVSHPVSQVSAGDVTYEKNGHKYNNIKRNISGVSGKYSGENWDAHGSVGAMKGTYNQLEFKGQDGHQGPYFLTGRNGNRDVSVIAGSEKVWLNGQVMLRGLNHDYTVDYASAELTFTPKNLIHFDSDIVVEYEYSVFQFNRNLVGTSFQKRISNTGTIDFSFTREKDNDKSGLSEEERVLLSSLGDGETTLNTWVPDENGMYHLKNGILTFMGSDTTGVDKRYSAVFYYAGSRGVYQKKISPEGILYYEYLMEEDRLPDLELYLPEKPLSRPEDHQLAHLAWTQDITPFLQLNSTFALSSHDVNTLSSLDDSDNRDMAYTLKISSKDVPIGREGHLRYAIETWQKNERFKGMGRDRDPLFYRGWNSRTEESGQEKLLSLSGSYKNTDRIQADLSVSRYTVEGKTKERITQITKYKGENIKQLKSYINIVNAEDTFKKSRFDAKLFPGKFHPIFSIDLEENGSVSKYNHLSAGYQYSKGGLASSFFVGRRKDWKVSGSPDSSMTLEKEGYFGEFDWSLHSQSGWRQRLNLRKRILNHMNEGEDKGFSLGQIMVSFRDCIHPIQWDLTANMDESSSEKMTVVYDFVGTGLGHYRFDETYQEYISDPNGAYRAQSVFSGERQSVTRLGGTSRLTVDFSKTGFSLFKSVFYRGDYSTEFRGNSFKIIQVTHPSLTSDSALLSRWYMRHEFDYSPKVNAQRVKVWILGNHSFSGIDPRGNELRLKEEAGLFIQGRSGKRGQLFFNSSLYDFSVESLISPLRNRESKGVKGSLGMKGKMAKGWQWSFKVESLKDLGKTVSAIPFTASAVGLSSDLLIFLGKKSRLDIKTAWYSSNSNQAQIPPEALNGLSLGRTLRTSIQGSFIVGKNLSINGSFLYVDNARYSNLITMKGEIRAYF